MEKFRIPELVFATILFISCSIYAQTGEKKNNANNIVGQYKSDRGLQFFLQKNGSFYILKGHNKAFDAVIPGCDTISKGTWRLFSNSIIKLSNDKSFESVKIEIHQENRLSKDSIYIKVTLPDDDAFFKGKFKYQVSIRPKIGYF